MKMTYEEPTIDTLELDDKDIITISGATTDPFMQDPYDVELPFRK